MHPFLANITLEFEKAANPQKAKDFHEYLMGNFDFFGIKTFQRRHLCKVHFKRHIVKTEDELNNIVKEAWALHLREYQYYAVDLLIHNKKLWSDKTIELINFCITTKSWWDTIDPIDAGILTPYFTAFPQHIEPYSAQWNKSENVWLQRCSIMFQKHFKKNTNVELLGKYILNCIESDDFHVQKAIGWALREYSKTNPEWVSKFVDEHRLKPLSDREARRIIEE